MRKILVNFIKQETLRFGIKKCVIGLSGGIDSSLSAFLAVEALGKQNVHGLLLPYSTSSKESISDALAVVSLLKIKSKIIDITNAADGIINNYNSIDKIRIANIVARTRMIALYDYSNLINGLVIGTSNKTELLLGYTTIFGDAASAINPLGDLYKTQLVQFAKTFKIPKSIIRKKPSADLWLGQTDEGELGFTYKDVDMLLYYMIDLRYTDEEIIDFGFKETFIKKVRSIINKNQFKRLPPVIAKVSNRTINIDYRYNRDIYS